MPILRSIIRDYEKVLFQRKWRRRNPLNTTVAGNIFPIEIVSAGKMSYGMLNILSYSSSNEQLRIGNYVSIAPNVLFVLGGNHHIDTITSFPLYSLLISSNSIDAESKGPIIIEDEVWIGVNAMILSGVTIKKGAIIAAGSVVTKDVPPYAVYGGNPARIIKYRFSAEIINMLMSFHLSDVSDEQLRSQMDVIYKKIESADDVVFIRKALVNEGK